MGRNSLTAWTTIILTAVASAAVRADEPFADLTYAEALTAAKKDDKIVLIDFYTTWCGPCKKLDQTTWKAEHVRKWLGEKAIALKIDAEKEKDLAGKLRINAYPTIVLLKADETEIDRLVGYRDAETFLSEVKAALAGKDSVARAKEKIEGDKKDDPMARMDYARTLVRQGRNEEALREFLWCFDEGNQHSVGFGGVRLSFLLSDIVRLGRAYPPAMEALKTRRDRAEKLLREMKKSSEPRLREFGRDEGFDAVMIVNAINRALGNKERTLTLFEDLGQRDSDASRYRWVMMKELLDDLIEDQRYKDIMGCGLDVLRQVNQDIELYEHEKDRFADEPHSSAEFEKKRALADGGKYFEAALGVKQFKTGERIAKKLTDLDKTSETYVMLIEHARRAKAHMTVWKLVKWAEKHLGREAAQIVRRAAEQAPKDEPKKPRNADHP